MSSNINPRKRILKGLQKVLDNELSREEVLEYILEDLPNNYRSKWTSLFYGCLRSYNYLMPWLEEVRRRSGKPKKLPREVQFLLLMAAHQFKLMSSFPSYAVIQESLKLIPKRYFSLRKYIGFLLREIERTNVPIPSNIKLPKWLLNEFPKILQSEVAVDFSQRLIEEPTSALYTKSPVQSDVIQAIGRDVYTFENLNLKQRLDMIEEGAVFGELLSLTMPIRFVGQPLTYLDLCSAPGTKLGVALQKYPKAKFWAVEKDSSRYRATLERLEQNYATRKELHRLNFVNEDALQWMEQMDPESMDFILLDAPCSALGTILNHPEFLTIKQSQSFDYLPDLQFELLSKALCLLKPGGQIIFSVCTFRLEETEMIIKRCSEQYRNIHLANDGPILGERIFKNDYGQYIWGVRGRANQLFYFQRIVKEK